MSFLYQEITEKILAACFAVRNELGAGFLESVYQNAMLISLEEKVMLELKAVSALTKAHKAQLINYFKATGIEVGLLINFGSPRLEYIRLHN